MKICFVSENICNLLDTSANSNRIGGAELQQLFIGKLLQQEGISISYVTCDLDKLDDLPFNQYEIFYTYKQAEGIRVLRFFYPRLYKLWSALKKADADLYYTRTAGYLCGILAIFCRIYNKKLIFAGAHDTDFIPERVMISNFRDKLLYHYGLRRADLVIVQSNAQSQLIWENFGLRAEVVRNLHPGQGYELPLSQRKYILWVGTLRAWKRPMHYIRLARNFPEEQFVMIGGPDPSDPQLHTNVCTAVRELPNVSFLGFQPYGITESYFNNSKVFINTSNCEGFPNTFLQAWRRGIPVISYFDPDDVIKENNLGLVIRSERELNKALGYLLPSSSWNSKKIVDYFLQNHSETIIEEYIRIFQRLLKHQNQQSVSLKKED